MRRIAYTGLFLSAICLPLAAQSSPDTNVINACVGTLTGVIREVPNAGYCIKGLETFQQFNMTGPQGPQGMQGPAGVAGAKGATGAIGPQGPTGMTGAAGATGAQGIQGIQGLQGPAGAAGNTGAAGPQGVQGIAGATGSQGPQGLTGTAGATGAAGPQGLQGVAGATGSQGIAGATGSQGPIGLTGTTGAVGPQGLTGAAGATGAQGIAGATGSQGVVGPAGVNYRGNFSSSTTYSQGDVVLYNNALYEETTGAGTAVTGVSPTTPGTYTLFLPAGPAGAAGVMGANGATGATGPAGPNGATGPAGAGSSLTYTIHYYQNITVADAAPAGSYDVHSSQVACPVPEIAIAASCGYQYPVGNATFDQHNLNVNYAGLGYGSDVTVAPTQASCLTTNSATNTRNVLTGVSCLAAVSTSSANAAPAVVKSCTYDPDTQAPCTAADAVPGTEVHPGVFQSAAAAASTNVAQAATAASQGNGTPKVKKSVTLWFRE